MVNKNEEQPTQHDRVSNEGVEVDRAALQHHGAKVVSTEEWEGKLVTLITQRDEVRGECNYQPVEIKREAITWDCIVANGGEVWKNSRMGGSAFNKKKHRYVRPIESNGKAFVHLESKNFQGVHKKYEKMVWGIFREEATIPIHQRIC